jgi:hypothetical protein
MKIDSGDIIKPLEKRIPLNNNIRFISTYGVHLNLFIDSTLSNSYLNDTSIAYFVSGDTLVIRKKADLIKATQPNSVREEEDLRQYVYVNLKDFNEWKGVGADLSLSFITYKENSTYSLKSFLGKSLSISKNQRNYNANPESDIHYDIAVNTAEQVTKGIQDEEVIKANLSMELQNYEDIFNCNATFQQSEYKLLNSNLRIKIEPGNIETIVHYDPESEVFLPYSSLKKIKMIPLK